MSKFVIKVSQARMPSSCKFGSYSYRNIAVLEIDDDKTVDDIKMISERARGVIRIVHLWERVYVGSTSKCQFGRAFTEALKLKANKEGGLC